MESRFRQVLGSTALRLSAIVWTFGYILVEVTAMVQGRSAWGEMFLANVPLLLLGICQSVGLGLLLDRLDGRPGYQRWPAIALAGLVAGLVQTAADDTWLRFLSLTLVPSWQAWAVPWQPTRLFMILILYLWTMYLTAALIWAARTSDQARMNQARAAAFEAAASRAEAAALRLQLNPHFLFNTLNGIASLVVRNRQSEAEDMIGRLADFLRSSLSANPTDLVPLHQELETIAAYLNIEETRFGERLRTEIAVAPELRGLLVPNFILQPLVENAIKHGAAKTRGPLTITVSAAARDGEAVLGVLNTTAGAARESAAVAGETRRGIGLSNTRQRLAAHYGDAAWLECRPLPGGYRVELGIPLAPALESAA
ncbi:histidine kinase [Sphingomonas parva]|uniref:Histidine kinase n=1 Tax=Sphingomonas parva TaxID=2555898 RepID=A0A4Y8ZKC1_9SPHN|nr:histidine kinase [Sphingomonas parva]TFI56460.1 histidine kinase [Sphingomonas parva]